MEEEKKKEETPMRQHKSKSKTKELKQKDLLKRLQKEISPFTLTDLPLSFNEEENFFAEKYLFQKVLGAGSYGVVVAAIDRAHLEQCAIKVKSRLDSVDYFKKLSWK